MPGGYGHQPFPLAIQRYPNSTGFMSPEWQQWWQGPQKSTEARDMAGDAKPPRPHWGYPKESLPSTLPPLGPLLPLSRH